MSTDDEALLLEVENISVSFGETSEKKVLNGISFFSPKGRNPWDSRRDGGREIDSRAYDHRHASRRREGG